MKSLVSLSATLLLAVRSLAGEVSLSVGEPFLRTPATPRSLSGLTADGQGGFYAVADDARGGEVGLYRCRIRLAEDGLSVREASVETNVVRLAGARDLEAVAFDAGGGCVWASDESTRTVSSFDPVSGKLLSRLPLPDWVRRCRSNLVCEALTIAPDGLTLWTCNEEAIPADGDRSSPKSGTVVRLMKFVRTGRQAPWTPSGVFPYRTEKWRHPGAFGSLCRRGVAALTALPDGSLLVLERDLSFTESLSGQLSFAVYRVANPEEATDVTAFAALAGADWKAVAKTELASGGGALMTFGNFEGMCLGPKLADGRRSLLLVSDAGDGFSRPLFLPLVLTGIE